LRLQEAGDLLDKQSQGKWVLEELDKLVRTSKSSVTIVVDCVRNNEQLNHVRNAFPQITTHVHLTAPPDELRKRYNRRYREGNAPTYDKVKENRTEANADELKHIADISIDTDRCLDGDVLVRAASYMGLYGYSDNGYVDVVVGSQFGSEGKGQIVAYLAKEYDLLVRVGGPNAGHKVFELPEPYTHHHLPSGTRRSEAKLLLGPGMIIHLEKLLKEIGECNVDAERLSIDPNAMVITDDDIEREKELEEVIGSTRQGVGRATARKITHRWKRVLTPWDVPMAGDLTELKPFTERSAEEVLSGAFARDERVLLEGTQGTGLSLHHGSYPYVTSRDTTVAGCLAEAGIAPSRVRRIIMVSRTYPIRVQNPPGLSSGPLSKELTWKEISERSQLDEQDLLKTEKTSTTNRSRRIGEFDWVLLRKSAFLNGPTDIALTFTDYLSKKNREAKRFEQLTSETIDFIEELERVSHARVSLITTGFNFRSIIDRRSW